MPFRAVQPLDAMSDCLILMPADIDLDVAGLERYLGPDDPFTKHGSLMPRRSGTLGEAQQEINNTRIDGLRQRKQWMDQAMMSVKPIRVRTLH